VEEFANLFMDEVNVSVRVTCVYFCDASVLADWITVTSEEVEKPIGRVLAKACWLDLVSTWVVKDFCELLSLFVTLQMALES